MSRARRTARLLAGSCAALASSAPPAAAHLVETGFGGFYDGAAHLLLTPQDLLAVIGLGLLAGLRGRAPSRALLCALPAAWLAGGGAGLLARGAAEPAWASASSFGLIGLLVALNAPLPRALVVALGVLAGALHGFSSGVALAASDAPLLGLAGSAALSFALLALVAAGVVGLRPGWTRIAVRVAGSWIAALGILTLGWLWRAA